jgi:glucose dehydrogenase
MCFGKPEVRAANRVFPSRHCDKYGLPQVDVHYRFTESDLRMQQRMIYYGKRILRKCSGLIVTVYPDARPGGAIHYAGTCRMADRDSDGVVDKNLQTFDHPNLYICDGSVLPEISEKNLTLTIMALANRLARHLTASHENEAIRANR